MSIFGPLRHLLASDEGARTPGSYFYSSHYEAVSKDGWTAVRRGVNDNGRVRRDGLVIDAQGNAHPIDYDRLPGEPNRPVARIRDATPADAPGDPSRASAVRAARSPARAKRPASPKKPKPDRKPEADRATADPPARARPAQAKPKQTLIADLDAT